MRRFKTLDELPGDLTGKRVLVRVDLNVPMEGGRVTDATRIERILAVLQRPDFHKRIQALGGYETTLTGQVMRPGMGLGAS